MTMGPIDPLPEQDPFRTDPIEEMPAELLTDEELYVARDLAEDPARYGELTEEQRKRLLEQQVDDD